MSKTPAQGGLILLPVVRPMSVQPLFTSRQWLAARSASRLHS